MHSDPFEIFKMIVNKRIRYPEGFDKSAKSIIRHLTHRDLSKRYGNLKNGSLDIKNHRFFNDVNFMQVITMAEKPRYTP